MSNLSLYRITTSFDEALFWMDQSMAFFESSKVLDNSPSEPYRVCRRLFYLS